MSSSPHQSRLRLIDLPLPDLANLDAACLKFEEAWRSGSNPSLETFLEGQPAEQRPLWFGELLRIELEYLAAIRDRPQEKDQPRDEEYRARFPAFADEIGRVFAECARSANDATGELLPKSRPHGSASGLDRPARFRHLRALARGGLGEVSVALDADLGREVAWKEIRADRAASEEAIARFVREAGITGRLEHPGIVPVYGIGWHDDGRPYYVMRFVRGETMREAIRSLHAGEQTRDWSRNAQCRRLLNRFNAACQAIDYAHSRGVVHRDLKPENILLGPHGETLVVDWGLARLVGGESNDRDVSQPASPADVDVPLTLEGNLIGTVAYMGPEQAAGNPHAVTAACDIYSLGATLYCLLTGRPPHAEGDVEDRVKRIARGDFPTPRAIVPSIPRALEAICLKAMSLRPEDRYESASALADDLDKFLADEPVSARIDSAGERLSRAIRRNWAWVQAMAALVVLLAIGISAGSYIVRQQRQAARLAGVVESVRTADLESLARLVHEAETPWSDLGPLLHAAASRPGLADREKMNLALLLARDDVRQLDWLAEQMVAAAPRELLLICEMLRPHRAKLAAEMWNRREANRVAENGILPLACILAQYAAEDERWGNLAEEVAITLARQNPLLAAEWMPGFRPVAAHLVGPLEKLCRTEKEEPAVSNAAQLLGEYAGGQTETILSRLLDGEPRQLAPLIGALRSRHRDAAPQLYAVLNSHELPEIPQELQDDPDSRNPLARLIVLRARQGRAAVALLALGETGVWEALDVSPDPTVRTWMAQLAAQAGVPAMVWLAGRDRETDLGRQRLILHALGQYRLEQLPEAERGQLLQQLEREFVLHPDAGMHAAIGWLLRRWNRAEQVVALEKQLARAEPQASRGWYVNRHGQSFSVVPGPQDLQIGARTDEWFGQPNETLSRARAGRSVAVCQTEVTVEQFRQLMGEDPSWINHFSAHGDCPATNVNWLQAARYCRLLSDAEGIPKDQMCFPTLDQIQLHMQLPHDYLERTGYRLPTEAEWEMAGRAGTLTRGHYGVDPRLAGAVGWHLMNSQNVSHRVRSLLPNECGLFDVHGNVWELTMGIHGENVMGQSAAGIISDRQFASEVDPKVLRSARGGEFNQLPLMLRAAAEHWLPVETQALSMGFRVVRTVRREDVGFSVVPDGSVDPGVMAVRVLGEGVPFEIRDVTNGVEVHPRRLMSPAIVQVRSADGRLCAFRMKLARLDCEQSVEVRGVAGQVQWNYAIHAVDDPQLLEGKVFEHWEKLTSNLPRYTGQKPLHSNWGTAGLLKGLLRDNLVLAADAEIELPAGFYEFFLRSDEAARLRVDGEPVLMNSSLVPSTTWLQLPAGKHRLELRYFERTGDARLQFEMKRLDSIGQLQVAAGESRGVGSSRVDLQACKLEYSIVSPK